MNRRPDSQSGIACIELALALVVLLPLVLGAINFGLYMHGGQVLSRAAREGAMLAAQGYEPAPGVIAYLQGAGFTAENALVNVNAPANPTLGSEISVTVSYDLSDRVIFPWDSVLPAIAALEEATAVVRYQ